MNTLSAGFSRTDITPMMDIAVSGYFKPRFAKGILDPLEVNALVLGQGETRVALISADLTGINNDLCDKLRKAVADATGIPDGAVFIFATHTHTAPYVNPCSEGNEAEDGTSFPQEYIDSMIEEYVRFVTYRVVDAARMAVEDMSPCRMGTAVGKAENIAFVRRFIMKDGTVKTNPGVNNPDIERPVGEIDDKVNVVRFDREGKETIVLANFGCHPDVVGGSLISADWPGLFRRTFEKAVDNTKCIFLNGAQGDINHVNVFPRPGDLNDMFMDFDDVSRGYGHARHMGRVVAAAVLSVYDKVEYKDVDSIRFGGHIVDLPANVPDKADLPLAHKFKDLHDAGKDAEIPYDGMMLTTVVAEALRMCRFENGPETIPLPLSAIKLGDVVFIGVPGEPFNGVGKAWKEAFKDYMVCPCCLTNGNMGYFPMMDSYDEGGYEARSSEFKAGVAELIISEGKKLVEEINEK